MDDALARFVSGSSPLANGLHHWGSGTIPLRVETYLTHEEPPDAYTTSVRSVVSRGASFLVFWDRNTPSILPGGRRESGESLLDTLRRELLEETGIQVHESVPIGFLHFHHLGPMPADWRTAYPDFLQAVYLSRAQGEDPGAKVYDPYVTSSAFLPPNEIEALPLRAVEWPFLQSARATRGDLKTG